MVRRSTESRLFPIASNKKRFSQLLKSSNAYLVSPVAYATASPPPGFHVIISVAGSPTGIDDALKRYALGVDERAETMRSLQDARRKWGTSCENGRACAYVLHFCLFSFFRVGDPVFQGVQLEEKRGKQCQRVATPQPPAISVFLADFFPPSRFLASFYLRLDPSYTIFFGRSTSASFS